MESLKNFFPEIFSKAEIRRQYDKVTDRKLVIAIDEVNSEIIDHIVTTKSKKLITLDNFFSGNDKLKTNTVMKMEDVGIDSKTI